MAEATPVVVVGAGPAGLATAACLRMEGINAAIVDRGDGVGQSWRDRYERLHLHTPRVQSHLPGYRIPRAYGRWVARADVVHYLENYAAHHRLQPRLGIEVERIDRADDDWQVATSEGELRAPVVVVATGYNAVPFVPDWPGRDAFTGELLHAGEYRVAAPYVGRDVLVVGTGNTGAEIAADLAESGAGRVRLSVRTPPHVVPRSVGPLPTTLIGISQHGTPTKLADPVNNLIEKYAIGDLTRYGLPAPQMGLLEQFRANDQVPIIDVGLVEQLKAGRVEPVAAVDAFDGADVVLSDGSRITPDAVIAATGYRTGLDRLVGHLDILDDHGRPLHTGRDTHPRAPRLHFVGLTNPIIGLLNAIRIDARRTARAIAGQLETT